MILKCALGGKGRVVTEGVGLFHLRPADDANVTTGCRALKKKQLI